MKQVWLYIIVLCLTGEILAGCDVQENEKAVKSMVEYDKKSVMAKGYSYRSEKTKLDYDGNAIEADLKHVDLVIRSTKEEAFYLQYNIKSTDSKNPLDVSVQKSRLCLRESKAQIAKCYSKVTTDGTGKNFEIRKQNYTGIVTLYVPARCKIKQLTLQLREGDLELNGLTITAADIQMQEGDLFIDKGIFQGNAVLEDGDITTDKTIFSHNVTLHSESGDIAVGVNAKNCTSLSILADTQMDIEVSPEIKGKLTEREEKTSFCRRASEFDDTLRMTSVDGDIVIK